MKRQDAKALRAAPLATPTDLSPDAVRDVSGALDALLADVFALYFCFSTSMPIRSSPLRTRLRSGCASSAA